MTYRGWQVNPKNTFTQEVSTALRFYIEKNGYPPQVLEYSDQITGVDVLLDGLQLVVAAVHIPKNIILLGTEDANN